MTPLAYPSEKRAVPALQRQIYEQDVEEMGNNGTYAKTIETLESATMAEE